MHGALLDEGCSAAIALALLALLNTVTTAVSYFTWFRSQICSALFGGYVMLINAPICYVLSS